VILVFLLGLLPIILVTRCTSHWNPSPQMQTQMTPCRRFLPSLSGPLTIQGQDSVARDVYPNAPKHRKLFCFFYLCVFLLVGDATESKIRLVNNSTSPQKFLAFASHWKVRTKPRMDALSDDMLKVTGLHTSPVPI
jgi:hypothetical protein